MAEENKGAALPEPLIQYQAKFATIIGFTADQMRAFRAEGEADLRARLAAAEAEVVRLRAQRDEFQQAANDLSGDLTKVGEQRDEAVALLETVVDLGFLPKSIEPSLLTKVRIALASLKEQAA